MTTYRSSSKLRVIKVWKHSVRIWPVEQLYEGSLKSGFRALDLKLMGNLVILRQFRNDKFMIYNFIFRRCLRNFTGNGFFFCQKIIFLEVFLFFRTNNVRSQLINNFSLKNMKFCKNGVIANFLRKLLNFLLFKYLK